MAVAENVSKDEQPITIKKYANRRLYNTATSSYVTLDHLSEMVKQGQDFTVHDAKSGQDITRSVLTQIIFEEESKGQNLLPAQFLRQLIRFYGDSLQAFVPSYLEMSMENFSKNQEQLRERLTQTFGAGPTFGMFEEQVRQNIALFDRAVKMFTPFYGMRPGEEREDEAPKSADDQEISDLKAQISALKKRLDTIDDA
ncbi:MAG: polyhydroxyalkanoate synthesis repressor PhaR [Pseudomonadota bacterium]